MLDIKNLVRVKKAVSGINKGIFDKAVNMIYYFDDWTNVTGPAPKHKIYIPVFTDLELTPSVMALFDKLATDTLGTLRNTYSYDLGGNVGKRIAVSGTTIALFGRYVPNLLKKP